MDSLQFDFLKQQQKQKTSRDRILLPPDNYLQYMIDTLPIGWSVDAKHIKLICKHLDMVEKGEIKRLMINMPPRHGKTETITVRFGAYFLERNPTENVLVTGYNERIARRFSRKSRQIVKERRPLSEDSTAQDEWTLPEGGTFLARGVGSPPTGVGFKLILIDDPIKSREDAESMIMRDKAWDWYSDDLFTRLEPGGAIIMVCTRWHEDDVAARALASEPDQWTVLSLPAVCDSEDDAIGRKIGDPLWKERYNKADLNKIKKVMIAQNGDYGWNALYQQQPIPRTGAYFSPEKIKVEPFRPKIVRQVRAWDLASTANAGDYTVGILLGKDIDNRIWILDMIRGQYDAGTRDRIIRQTAELDGTDTRIRMPQDPGQAGKSQKLHLVQLLQGFPVIFLPVSGSKQLRADPVGSQIAAENVTMLRAEWNRYLLDELRSFPLGKNDDIVDALADAYSEVSRTRTGWTAG